jgi:hypothetical protein
MVAPTEAAPDGRSDAPGKIETVGYAKVIEPLDAEQQR